jgi:hypothetical protein
MPATFPKKGRFERSSAPYVRRRLSLRVISLPREIRTLRGKCSLESAQSDERLEPVRQAPLRFSIRKARESTEVAPIGAGRIPCEATSQFLRCQVLVRGLPMPESCRARSPTVNPPSGDPERLRMGSFRRIRFLIQAPAGERHVQR